MLNLIQHYYMVIENIKSGKYGVRIGNMFSGFYTSYDKSVKAERIDGINEEIRRLENIEYGRR